MRKKGGAFGTDYPYPAIEIQNHMVGMTFFVMDLLEVQFEDFELLIYWMKA